MVLVNKSARVTVWTTNPTEANVAHAQTHLNNEDGDAVICRRLPRARQGIGLLNR